MYVCVYVYSISQTTLYITQHENIRFVLQRFQDTKLRNSVN